MKLYKYPSLLLFALVTLIVTACEKTHWDEYDRSKVDVCAFVHETSSFTIPKDEITVTLKRLSTEGTLTATIGIKNFVIDSDYVEEDEEVDAADWFDCPASVTFADGSATAKYSITIKDNERHVSGNEYTWTFVVADEHAAPGCGGCAVTATYK